MRLFFPVEKAMFPNWRVCLLCIGVVVDATPAGELRCQTTRVVPGCYWICKFSGRGFGLVFYARSVCNSRSSVQLS